MGISTYTLLRLCLYLWAFICIVAAVETVIRIYEYIKHLRRRRAVDRRVISQAKGAGVWDKQPIVLGGRALELKAKQDYKIKRKLGETDAQLRRRYMAAADEAATRPPKRRRIKLPHMSFEGKFSLFPPKIPKLVIRWYKEVNLKDLKELKIQITEEEAEKIAKELSGSLVLPKVYLEEALKEKIQPQQEERKNE